MEQLLKTTSRISLKRAKDEQNNVKSQLLRWQKQTKQLVIDKFITPS